MGRQPCCEKIGLKRGPWTAEEDKKLMNFFLTNGQHCWRLVPKLAGLQRCGKSCRLRWTNYLRPDLKRGAFSEAEENQIIELHARLGNRWSKIAAHFSGRTDNEIKNHWNTRIKKRLKLLGLDPQTHKPINNSDTSYDMPAGKEEEGETDAREKSTFSSSQNYVGADVADYANDIGKESEIELDDTAAFWHRYNMLWETQLDSNHVNETSNSSASVATLSSSATTAMATATTPPPLASPSVAATAECFAFPRENSSSILDELRPLWDERIDYFRVWDGVQFLDGIL